ncbi:hypothetical protein [Streptomyces sp. NPDC127039]
MPDQRLRLLQRGEWPPRGISSYQRRSVNRCSASRRDGRVMSRG